MEHHPHPPETPAAPEQDPTRRGLCGVCPVRVSYGFNLINAFNIAFPRYYDEYTNNAALNELGFYIAIMAICFAFFFY